MYPSRKSGKQDRDDPPQPRNPWTCSTCHARATIDSRACQVKAGGVTQTEAAHARQTTPTNIAHATQRLLEQHDIVKGNVAPAVWKPSASCRLRRSTPASQPLTRRPAGPSYEAKDFLPKWKVCDKVVCDKVAYDKVACDKVVCDKVVCNNAVFV